MTKDYNQLYLIIKKIFEKKEEDMLRGDLVDILVIFTIAFAIGMAIYAFYIVRKKI